MTHEEEANRILHEYRVLLMDEGDDFGEEILVSMLSKKMAIIHVNGIIEAFSNISDLKVVGSYLLNEIDYWKEVKQIIKNK